MSKNMMEQRNVYPQAEPAPPYPGPPLGYNVGMHQPTAPHPVYNYTVPQPQIVHTTSHVVMVQPMPTDASAPMLCPSCQVTMVSNTRHVSGLLTWTICAILGIFMCWPCCLIPFCVDSCKDVEHSCPNCHRVLHVHKQL